MAWAHSANDHGERHELVDHLRGTARRAALFAESLHASDSAYRLGLWHDIGKFNPLFQQYLLECEQNPTKRGYGPDHKAAGSWLALEHLQLCALLVQGHHGGLRSPTELQSWLRERSQDAAVKAALGVAMQEIEDLAPTDAIPLPAFIQHDGNAAELFLRLLFSALVDADYLDTEQHFRADAAAMRGSGETLEALWRRFESDQRRRFANAPFTLVNRARQEILERCLAAAALPPGLFRLSVPTGGGKTRSAMGFALRHGVLYGHRRVIVAVPFISITEQTADVYRAIFESGDDAHPIVLEHHSESLAISGDGQDFHPSRVWARLAAENWDAPIVVTTTVQLFESLFAYSPSRCRKLHRLAGSVIVLDEAQALPAHLLEPILGAVNELCQHYGVTVVVSTATQPTFEAIPAFADLAASDIVPDAARFFDELRRVTYEWRIDPPLTWPDVGHLIREGRQALAVLNTKDDALSVLEALDDPEALYLSTRLCGAHRRRVIADIKARLAAGQPCRLVSTQVVEAGVDIDFPLVLRALGPLDGIIQAAGRCNREGSLARGRIVVFRPAQGGLPTGGYRTATGITGALAGGADLDPDDPAVSRAYFRQLFETLNTDREGIQALRKSLEYPEVSRRFRMIGETNSVVVPYGSDAERHRVGHWMRRLRAGVPEARSLLRRLQPYVVSVRTREYERFRNQGLIGEILPGFGEWLGGYDGIRGLLVEGPELIV